MKSYRYLVFTLAFASCVAVTHAQVTLNPSATRALGAARLEQLATLTNLQPNLVEGRELNSPEGIALDLSSNPIHLYVADTLNNRILGWKDANCVAAGNPTCLGAYADLVIGQNDFFTTLAQGPGRAGSTLQASGMTAPMGMAVDAKGSLYVIDAGNNRILRFPAPFNQTGGQFPDMVIGQQNFNSLSANAGGIGSATLSFSTGGSILQAYLKFDTLGNLWVADAGNQRVLRFPASSLTANGPSADLVLGQPDFSTNTVPKYDPTSLTTLNFPTGIMFDPIGRLYITESIPSSSTNATRSRILVFQPPYSTFQAAQRIIGTVVTPVGGSPPPTVGPSQLGAGAGDMFAINNNIAVADTTNNRIMIYNPFQQFTSDPLTQNALLVVCQVDSNSGKSNRGNSDANSNTCASPGDAVFLGAPTNVLFVVDTGNNRLIAMPMTPNSSTLGFNSATGLLGQQQFSETAVNYIEGREFHFSDDLGRADGGVAVDNSSNPPHLYVADTYNNRILCFVDYRTVQTGGTATFVIGQKDLFHADVNYNPNSPTSNASTPTQSGLNAPTGMVVDPATGDLYVADSGNSRVLRFPSPFTQSSKFLQPADLVLGQVNFTTSITDVSASRMFEPYGLAWAPGAGLLVSDVVDNRVLLFGPQLTSGMSATSIWGQLGPTTASAGSSDDKFNGPHGIAIDSAYRLYVADSSNNRVQVFDDVRKVGNDPHALLSIAGVVGGSLNTPRAVYIDQYTPPGGTQVDELWVGDSGRALRFSGGYNQYFTSNGTPDLVIPVAGGALALAVDQYGSLYVCDIANRVAIYYIALSALNGASYNTSRTTVAPNTILSLFSQGGQFTGTQAANSLPLPSTMQSLQVLLNGTPLPLYYVSPGQINCLVPNNAPTSGTADLQVVRTDDGQTLGDTTINMNTVAPGIFTFNGTGKGQAAAINDDGTANSSSNAISRGHTLQVFGTGFGNIPGLPSDGSAPAAAIPTAATAQAFVNGIPCTVTYSGVAPGEVGVWQVNVLISQSVPPTSTLSNRTSELSISLGGVQAEGLGLYGIQVTIWVKQ